MRYESLNASHTGAWIAPFSHSTALANAPHSAPPKGTYLTSIGSPTEPALSNHLPAIPTIASALQKLMKANGYPLDSFDLAKADVKVSKRFGRYKKKLLDGGESRLKCFHGIRKYVATTLEREGVPEGITADLLGHEKQTMTYGVYSGGSSIEQLVSAVKKLEKAQK